VVLAQVGANLRARAKRSLLPVLFTLLPVGQRQDEEAVSLKFKKNENFLIKYYKILKNFRKKIFTNKKTITNAKTTRLEEECHLCPSSPPQEANLLISFPPIRKKIRKFFLH
jgi:biotin synthase-like enzyme